MTLHLRFALTLAVAAWCLGEPQPLNELEVTVVLDGDTDAMLRLRWQPGSQLAERVAVATRFALLHDLDFALGGACGAITDAGRVHFPAIMPSS
jgi:hypothetical protein